MAGRVGAGKPFRLGALVATLWAPNRAGAGLPRCQEGSLGPGRPPIPSLFSRVSFPARSIGRMAGGIAAGRIGVGIGSLTESAPLEHGGFDIAGVAA